MPSIYKRTRKVDGQKVEIGNWYIQYYHNGKLFKESSHSEKFKDAQVLLNRRLGEISTGKVVPVKMSKVKISELLGDLLTNYKLRKIGSLASTAAHINRLQSHLGNFLAVELTTRRISSYVEQLQGNGLSNATINRDLAMLRRAFTLALRTTPPKVSSIPFFQRLPEDNVRTGFFSREEFESLRDNLPPYLQPPVSFAYYTGCRKGEIFKLRWDQVDLENRIVRLNPFETKNDEPRIIPLVGELVGIISNLPRISEWLFCHSDGAPLVDCRDSWDNACEAAGLEGRLFHDLRRTGVRNLIRAGVPERVAMAISGHKTRAVFDRYNIVSEEDLQQAARKLERFSTPTATPKVDAEEE